MAKKVIAANLLDMIELITSRKLQEEVFTHNAPDLHIIWDRLPRNIKKRAEILYAHMEKLANEKKKALRVQHANVFRALNTIALVNADSTNTAEIEKRIQRMSALKVFYQNSFTKYDLPAGPRKTAYASGEPCTSLVRIPQRGIEIDVTAAVLVCSNER